MEVGAVKQAFNNEIILLKKHLNQAKINTIHKLTRRAKTYTEKKLPEPLKEKLKRKAESAIKEVLIIKKVKARDIARFIVTHKGKLNDFLNKPVVNNEKAYARLLLHKALHEKYKHIRDKFVDISIKDLFMSRQERRKLKKEAREKQKNKKKSKEKPDTVNVEGESDVEMTNETAVSPGGNKSASEDASEDSNSSELEEESQSEAEASIKSENSDLVETVDNHGGNNSLALTKIDADADENSNESSNNIVTTKNAINISKNPEGVHSDKTFINVPLTNKKHAKNVNKNKNLNKKLEKRNFHKKSNETQSTVHEMVDPFFITSTGENYISLVEPRPADEVKEVHKEGNRQYRRAIMFGKVPKIKPKNNNFDKQNSFHKQNNPSKPSKKNTEHIDRKQSFGGKERKTDKKSNNDDSVPEKLHPSWEAKKKQSGILPFEGKKIIFDES